MRHIILALIFTVCLGATVFAQPIGYPSGIYTTGSGRQRSASESETLRRVYDYRVTEQRFNNTIRPPVSYGRVTVSQFSKELEKQAGKYIYPENALKQKYASFLKLPNTGITKLLQEKACLLDSQDNKTGGNSWKKLMEKCPFTFIQGGARFFSFRQKAYVKPGWADIGIKDNLIFSFGAFNQGVLVNLGDVALEDVSLTSKGVEYLSAFVPSESLEESEKEFKQFKNGLTVNGFSYRQILPAALDKTFVLRVAAYETDFFLTLESDSDKMKYYPVKGDERADVIVAFRIVGKDESGDLVLLWKELRRSKSPKLIISK